MNSVVLAEDHTIVREGVRMLLSGDASLNVVGEASDGREAVALVERLQPDVLILDVMLPGLNGLDVIRQVCQRSPHTAIVMLTMFSDEGYVLEALRLGARGYVLKQSSSTDLLAAVQAVLDGRTYLSAPLSERAITSYVERARERPLDPYDSLTPREREVLHLVAEGYTAGAIAEQLHISPRTAEVHRTNVLRKLNLGSQIDLVRYAIRRGIIPLES
ncbi:MAG: response regulator transcription factor [Oscillochloris sp.]|nr:response regulator transcription factor [Oscillochloris sp.]